MGGLTIGAQPTTMLALLPATPLPRPHTLRAFWSRCSVRAQLLLVFMLIDLIAVFIAGGVAILRARTQTRVEMAASMRLAELLVGDAVTLARQASSAEQLLAILPAQLQSMRHVRIRAKDTEGVPIVAPLPDRVATDRFADAHSPAPAWFTALVAPRAEPLNVPVIVDGAKLGEIEIIGEPGDEIAEVWENMLAIGGVAVVLNIAVIVILYILFGRVLNPLTALAGALSDLERQSYHVRLPHPRAHELTVLTNHVNSLALALETARAENLSLNRRLITAQDDERRRTALELHDEVGPCLFGLKANASSIASATTDLPDKARQGVTERLGDILAIVDHLQAINRSMLDRLRPMALGHVPLKEVLHQIVRDRSRQNSQIQFTFTADDLLQSYGDSIDLTVYRCIQEGLTNAIRHAHPKKISVELGCNDAKDLLEFTVSDDGCGMSSSTRAGLGIRGMQERVEGLGGRYVVESGAGRGTCVRITIPFAEPQNSTIHATRTSGASA
jgi:two-component system sensor histidine kinase UhpB